MPYAIRRTEDVELARELHDQAFAGDEWPGDDNEFWIAFDEHQKVVGFCSAKFFPETKCAVLTRGAVVSAARGKGLQRRMIRTRVRWARQLGARIVVTYTSISNYPSITNLIREGFHLTGASRAQKEWHCFYLALKPRKYTRTELKPLLQSM